MDCQDYITESVERRRDSTYSPRGTRAQSSISERRLHEQSHCQGNRMFTNHQTGTKAKARHTAEKEQQGQKPGYSARRGEAVYKANKRSRKPHRICHCTRFIRWIIEQVKRTQSGLWMPASAMLVCTGCFQQREMVCTHTLYNEGLGRQP